MPRSEHGEEMEPAVVKPSTPAVKSPAAVIGIDRLWLSNGGNKQQCC